MRHIIARYLTILGMLLVMSLAACNTSDQGAVNQAAPTGLELVNKMEAAVKAVNTAHLTVAFQIASVDGPVKGTVEFWGERPGKMRAEVKSELPSLDGIVMVTDGQTGWAYNAREKLVLVSDKSQYKAQLRDQPELRSVLEFAEKMVDRGFEGTEAVNQGAEQVNGRDTYKVQVTYAKSDNPELDMTGITATFWIDQKTSLPQKIELSIDRDGFTASGFATVQGDIAVGQPIEADKFTFTVPTGVTVMDLSKLPQLPTLSDLPKIQ